MRSFESVGQSRAGHFERDIGCAHDLAYGQEPVPPALSPPTTTRLASTPRCAACVMTKRNAAAASSTAAEIVLRRQVVIDRDHGAASTSGQR
jgi:hypothetical protein